MSTTTHRSISEMQTRLPLRLARWAPQFAAAELCYGVDPLLLAAICDRESLGGEALSPKGPAGYGDQSHGRGLMQIDDRAHPNFTMSIFDDGVTLWGDPAFNVLYAARLLSRNIQLLNGDVPAAVAAYNAGYIRVKRTLTALEPDADVVAKLKAINALTTGGDYVDDVFRRRSGFLPIAPPALKSPPA